MLRMLGTVNTRVLTPACVASSTGESLSTEGTARPDVLPPLTRGRSTLEAMSCVRFNTPAQRRAMRDLAPTMLTAEEAARLHPAPPVNYNTPGEVLATLARDPDEGVRGCVARNEHAPCDVLRGLADDPDETVRGWLAVNFQVPADVMERLSADPSDTVRKLVRWKGTLVDA
jgi:hypothetical protein